MKINRGKYLRPITFLLAFLILSTCVACTEGGGSTTVTTPGDGTTTPPDVKDKYMDDLGKFDFEEYTFKVLSATSSVGTFTMFDTDLKGEVLNDSVYHRNREIEDRFNIVFSAEEDSYQKCFEKLRTTYLANADEYDLIMLINRNAYSAALSGYLTPVTSLTHLNLEKPYYLKDINEMTKINGVHFFVYSEESIYTFQRSCIIAFNKEIASDLSIPDLYETVRGNNWTLDTMFNYSSLAKNDVNGDGNMSPTDDVFGIYGMSDYLFPSFFISANELLIQKDDQDIPFFNAASSQKMSEIVDKVINYMSTSKAVGYNAVSVPESNKVFINNGALFYSTVLGRVYELSDMETDYGVLPWPKYTTEQDKYYTRVADAWLHVVPATATDPERTSVIMEALASGTARHVFPAYYENALLHRYLRDQDSIEMVEIIRNNRLFDWGDVTWYDTIRKDLVVTVFQQQRFNLVTFCAQKSNQVQTLIEEAIKATEGFKS